jgi:hypothetical protein
MLDSDIAVLGPAERFKSLPKRNDASEDFGIVLGVWMQERHPRHAIRLLRVRRKRPYGRKTPEQSDELTSLHAILGGSETGNSV